jgi:DNA-binding NarL/FixJ family response regulator
MHVLLVDSRVEERTSLRRLFKQDSELDLADEIADVDSLLAQTQAIRPDLVLLDWELLGMRPASMLQALQRLGYPLKVVAFSDRAEARREALAAGVDAFVSREEPVEELMKTVRAVGELSPCFPGQ